jgi:sirohydrochlorin cobaltochelatase
VIIVLIYGKTMRLRAFSLFALLVLPSATLNAQSARTGLLIVAHGATPAWNARVRETVAQVKWDRGPVAVAFLMGGEADSAGWSAGVKQLVAYGAIDAIVVPLMISTYGDHVRQIEHYAGVRSEIPAGLAEHDHRDPEAQVTLPMRVTGGLDAAPELGAILLDAWRALPAGDRARAVLLLAHGPQTDVDAAHWSRNLGTVGQVLSAGGLAADLRIALVRDDAAPAVRAAAIQEARDTVTALAARTRDSVVVIPILISTGSLDRLKLPGDLAGVPAAMRPAPLAPSPRLARWIERVALDALAARVATR